MKSSIFLELFELSFLLSLVVPILDPVSYSSNIDRFSLFVNSEWSQLLTFYDKCAY